MGAPSAKQVLRTIQLPTPALVMLVELLEQEGDRSAYPEMIAERIYEVEDELDGRHRRG